MRAQTALIFFCQQLRRMRRSITAWTVIWTLLSMLFATVFKSMSATAEQNSRIFESLPDAVLKTVNISSAYLTNPENFLSGQFLTIYLLAGSIFAVIMGVNAIGGRIQNKTIMNYLSKCLPRTSLFLAQAAVLTVTLTIMNIAVGAALLASFHAFSNVQPSFAYIAALCGGTTVVFTTFAVIGMLAGTLLEKPAATAAGSALAIISFFVNGLGALAGVPSWLQTFSVYYYFDTVQLHEAQSLDPRIFVMIVAIIIVTAAGTYCFRKKNIYL